MESESLNSYQFPSLRVRHLTSAEEKTIYNEMLDDDVYLIMNRDTHSDCKDQVVKITV